MLSQKLSPWSRRTVTFSSWMGHLTLSLGVCYFFFYLFCEFSHPKHNFTHVNIISMSPYFVSIHATCMLLNCGVGEDSWESLGLQGDQISQSWGKSVLGVHWKDWYGSCSSNILATWCEELTHWKRPRCRERLKEEKGVTKDEMVGSHHQLDGHEVEQAPGVGDGQRRLVHGVAELDTTELNWTDLHILVIYVYPLSSILCECLKDPACCCCLVAQSCPTVWTPWTVAHQAPLSMGSSRQEHRCELPFPSPEGSSIVPDI